MARTSVIPYLVALPLLVAAGAGWWIWHESGQEPAARPGAHPSDWEAAKTQAPLNPILPVRLGEYCQRGPVPLHVRGAWRIVDLDGAALLEGSEFRGDLAVDELGLRLGAFRFPRDGFRVHPAGDAALQLSDRWYRGVLHVALVRDVGGRPQRLETRLELPLEDYVLGVVCGEMPTVRAGVAAALEAQAVCARTYALWRLHQGRRFLYDDTRDQRLLSVDFETAAARAAVAATAGLVLSFDDALLPAYFHADCGGRTLDAEAAGFAPAPLAPLAGVIDEGCRNTRTWEEVVAPERLGRLARERGLGDRLHGLEVTKASGGWCLEARLAGPRRSHELRGEELRAALGLPSALITQFQSRRDGSLLVRGAGRGHGVGMCQVGAVRMSAAGASARQILQHYYPGARVASLAELPAEER